MDNNQTSTLGPLGLFGQIVIGPPGSGKSTYCAAMQEFLLHIGRTVAVVNLDPANDTLPYICAIDIRDLIQVDEVMRTLSLGPNGSLIYCLEYLYTNRDWLKDALNKLKMSSRQTYLIFDCPGQVEMYCNNGAFRKLLTFLTCSKQPSSRPIIKKLALTEPVLTTSNSSMYGLGLNLSTVHLVDSHYCSDPGKYISVLLTAMMAMLQLELPHVNVLSKVDLIENYGPLHFHLNFYTEVLDLSYLINQLEDEPFYSKHKKLISALASLVQDNPFINFLILDVQEKAHLERIMRYADKGNGYVFSVGEERTLQSLLSCAAGAEFPNDLVLMAEEKISR